MTVVTLGQVLELPVIREAGPVVVAGRTGLEREVRWVHSAELAEIGGLLREGDLLLSTGIALPEDADGLATFAESLAENDAAGLIIELGRRWDELPMALVAQCERLSLPLIALTNEVRFAAVIQTVGEQIVDNQLTELREAQRVHETFTELSIAEAGPAEILQAAQRLCGTTVVLEDQDHRVLDYRGGPGDVHAFLQDWPTRSRRVRAEKRSTWDANNGWLLTRVGRRDRAWGRLIVQAAQAPSPGLIATAERAAAALAMHRLHDKNRDSLTRRTHHELLVALLNDPADADLQRRCELAGFPLHRRHFIAATVRLSAPGRGGVVTQADDVIATVNHHLSTQRLPALVAVVDRDIRVLLSLPRATNADDAVDSLAQETAGKHPVAVTAGRVVLDPGHLDRTLLEAQQVMDALKTEQRMHPLSRAYRFEDAHLRGLLALFGHDPRISLFATRELGRLIDHDAQHGTQLFAVVRALLTHPTSKSAAAASLHLSRPAFYERLSRAESVLGVALDDPDIRVSLHVALVAHDLLG